MREKAIMLKGDANLAAIVTLPDRYDNHAETLAVIILNEGILHRIGSGRLHVKVARYLAGFGLFCLRLDHSSIGDSGPRRGSESFEEAAVSEVQLAMDYMTENYGCQKFIIYGLCSGSDVAFEMGVKDDRVAGLIQLDAHIYPTWKSTFNQVRKHYGRRLFKLSAWTGFVKRKFNAIITGKEASGLDVLKEAGRSDWYADPDYIRVKPPREYVSNGLKIIVDKGIPMYILFTDGGYYGVYNYVNQYRDAFPEIDFGDLLQLQFIPGCTHLITALNHQELVLKDIAGWLTKYEFITNADKFNQRAA